MFHFLRYLVIPARVVICFSIPVCLSLITTNVYSQSSENGYSKSLSPDRTAIEQDTRQILSRPEFRNLTQVRQTSTEAPFDWEKLFKDQAQKTPSQSNSSFFAFGGYFLLLVSYACVVCICCLILYLLFVSITGIDHRRKTQDTTVTQQLQGEMTLEQSVSPAENGVSLYLERAQNFAQSGDYHNAIIQLLYGSMSFIERSGWIRFRKGLTYRDYLRAARPHGLPGESFRQIIRTYEPLGFGRREATREHFESSLHSYEAAFQKKA